MTEDELIDAVKAQVSGTRSDPLTRDEVAQVVRATLKVMEAEATAAKELDAPG